MLRSFFFKCILLLFMCFVPVFSFTDIEDLTHKTGNYKQYSIFLSMLESALLQVSYIVPPWKEIEYLKQLLVHLLLQ